jgi:hypothetical protein
MGRVYSTSGFKWSYKLAFFNGHIVTGPVMVEEQVGHAVDGPAERLRRRTELGRELARRIARRRVGAEQRLQPTHAK